MDHVVRQVTAGDFDEFDLVVAMDHANRKDLRSLARSARSNGAADRIVLLRSWDPLGGPESPSTTRTASPTKPSPRCTTSSSAAPTPYSTPSNPDVRCRWLIDRSFTATIMSCPK